MPVLWKVAAATIRIAELMNRANVRATVESQVAYLIACRLPAGLFSNCLVCTIDECKYKL
ncbi:hypothetical protein D1872_274470 [compost metagenome]